VFIDVNLRAPWWDRNMVLQLIEGARWIKVNADELRTLVPERTALDQCTTQLQERFDLEAVFVTLGGDGALARTRDGTLAEVRPARDLKIVDTVGAGDAFASVLLLGLMLAWDLRETLDRAQEFASAVVGLRGATVNDKRFYEPFKRFWGIA
jgi:fructokinase